MLMFDRITPPARILVCLLCCAVAQSVARSGESPARAWHIPRDAHMITRWGRNINPDSVLSEYPRMQLHRAEWTSLNGLWEYAEAKEGEAAPAGRTLEGRILVPFPVESALSGVRKNLERLWYRRTFDLPKSWASRRIMLNFEAVDWEAAVYVNGTRVGDHRGGYDPFSFDITDALRPGSSQELIVGVFDPSDAGDQPRGKQVKKPEGIWYTSSTGIWQSVWIEPLQASHVSELSLTPNLDSASVDVLAHVTESSADETLRLYARAQGVTIATASGKPGSPISLKISSVRRWSPSDPFLYELKIELVRAGKVVDEIESYFAMRKVEIGKDARGIVRILLNGAFTMQVGPLDQGFWPDGLYSAPSDEALKSDIVTMRRLGFNMARKHVKVEPDRWYYWADRLGLLVWQDMPSGNNTTPVSRSEFETELAHVIAARRNHPSIIMWVLFNEGWGQYETERVAADLKRMDPSRLVDAASGWDDKKVGDVLDIHSYPKPRSPKAEPARAIVLGEFGGLGLAVPGHTWKKEHWGYQGMANRAELTSKYESFMRTVYTLKDDPGLSAAVYTQLTDVEIECNGIMTYDRAVIKPVLQRLACVNRGDFTKVPPAPQIRVIVPTSEDAAQQWQYTTERPGTDWFSPSFDAGRWKTGAGGFGTTGTPGAVVRTTWSGSDIWLRRAATVGPGPYSSLQLRIHHDEDAEVYINGILAGSFGGYTTDYEEISLPRAIARALKSGTIIIAVHCKQTSGGQYIDVGLIDRIPREAMKAQ